MLDDRDPCREQHGVGRPPRIVGRIDVQTVDPDKRRATLDQSLGGRLGQERSARAVGGRSEVAIPAGVEEDGVAP